MIYIWTISGRTCGAVWTFERYIDYELEGFVRDVQTEISKTECEDLCLSESRCRFFIQQLWIDFILLGFLVDLLLTIIWRGNAAWARKTGRNRIRLPENVDLLCGQKKHFYWNIFVFRFSQPGAYRVKQGSDYLENQCESRKHRCVTLQVTN